MVLPISSVVLAAGLLAGAPNDPATPHLPYLPAATSHNLGGPPRVGFDVLAAFDHKKGKALPASVTKFHKKKVTVAGFMERENPGSGPVEFFLIINDACGCTGSPKLTEIVFCATPVNKTTHLRPGLVTVTGTLYTKEQYEQGQLVAIYALDAESIDGKPLAGPAPVGKPPSGGADAGTDASTRSIVE